MGEEHTQRLKGRCCRGGGRETVVLTGRVERVQVGRDVARAGASRVVTAAHMNHLRSLDTPPSLLRQFTRRRPLGVSKLDSQWLQLHVSSFFSFFFFFFFLRSQTTEQSYQMPRLETRHGVALMPPLESERPFVPQEVWTFVPIQFYIKEMLPLEGPSRCRKNKKDSSRAES
ncbi:hypothetical protein IWZ03DRAFT_232297 [Phyllosticta citriasiana]|uniref:Uncharacterized protein n=1 Tax=Phyllosticta citriasiana TaxID=595635 RepID=A0ABR1KI50_9PEZI